MTDYLLVGAGTGAGFSLAEGLLRISDRAAGAIGNLFDGWDIGLGMSIQHVPGLAEIISSWLPTPVQSEDIFAASVASTTNLHLAYSAVAGFGVGLLLRSRGLMRLLGLVPIAVVAADHATYNHSLVTTTDSWTTTLLTSPLTLAHHLLWLYPLLFLIVAGLIDRRTLLRAKTAHGNLLLHDEGETPSPIVLSRYIKAGRWWTAMITLRFILIRRALMFALAQKPTTAGEPMIAWVHQARIQVDRWRTDSAKRVAHRPQRLQAMPQTSSNPPDTTTLFTTANTPGWRRHWLGILGP